ncbi:hypothetical protein NP603_12950 [Methylomonas sp. SURF-1]|uniref:Uncharacterized protein n=1 Tax=Methylomonas aurea TaxID=2952224 RepID=A0ABT1UJ25_9GAMM|nr:hypothetical protein [Methylomonas sp. SURF-1]MCQ8182021.1 hypothetical protein [Methylomonas sp. SURF-1]
MKSRHTRSSPAEMPADKAAPGFPSARYFQVHFEYLHETIGELKQQIETANRQIAELQRRLLDAGTEDVDLESQAGNAFTTQDWRL